MSEYITFMGLDSGVTGGIAILSRNKMEVYSIPIKQIIVNKKKKKTYDIEKIVEILKSYKDDYVIFTQEAVFAMKSQGVTSTFNFGKSSGITLGVAAALGFNITEVRPQTWKKAYPKLISTRSKKIKLQIKKLKEKSRTLKDNALEKENKKEIEKLSRQVKTEAKDASRRLVSRLYPKLKEEFKLKKDDGKAESVLICLYGKNIREKK